MKIYKSVVACIYLALVVLSCSENDATNPLFYNLGYQEEMNVSYGSHSDQKFDIYLPENRTPNTKVLILVHGGGWTAGDKSDMNNLKDLIKQDFPEIAIVNINYRLADQNNPPYPMQINDISSVVNFLKSHKSTYNISENYGFIGISAGAHLSLLWSYAFDFDNNTNMVCSIVGPTDFTDPAYVNSEIPGFEELLDFYGVESDTEYLEEISPYHQATTSAPPTILFYGGVDPLIPISQGTHMRDKLNELNIINQYTLYPTSGHGWVGLELLDTWTKLKTFTQTHL